MVPTETEIREQLSCLLKQDAFASSPRSAKLLIYLVDKTLNGEADDIKGYTIGVDVFDRPGDFDPQSDSIVRVQAGRLRKALSLYYLTEGRDDNVIIALEKGSYVPSFLYGHVEGKTKPSEKRIGRNVDRSSEEISRVKPTPDMIAVSVDKLSKEGRSRLRRIDRKITVLSALIGIVVILFSVITFLRPSQSSLQATLTEAALMPSGPSITVMPFEVVSIEGQDSIERSGDVLALGLQYELINALSRFRDLQIIAKRDEAERSSSAVASGLKTEYYLTGIIQRTEQSVRISSALFRSQDDQFIWSKTFDERLDSAEGVLQIQSSIASDVASALGQPYSVLHKEYETRLASAERRDFRDQYCLFEFYHYLTGKTEIKHGEVRDCLEQAVSADPEFSNGWAALSWMYGDEDRNGYNVVSRDKPPFEMALLAAKNAVTADNKNAMAYQYLSIAHFTLGDDEAFKVAANRALKLNPHDPEVLADIGSHLIQLGNEDEAPQMVEKAIALNPDHPPWYHGSLTMHYYVKGDREKTLFHARDYAKDGSLQAGVLYVAALVQIEDIERAKDVLQNTLKTYPIFSDNHEQTMRAWRLPETMFASVLEDLKIAGLGQV